MPIDKIRVIEDVPKVLEALKKQKVVERTKSCSCPHAKESREERRAFVERQIGR